MPNLLFIDDDADLLLGNRLYFTKSGYDVRTADGGDAAMEILARYKPDCIILDVMLPNINGFDLLKEIRAVSGAPVIFLSGRTEEESKITGLMSGGNDYVVKPYSLKELAARIQVQIRSSAAAGHLPRISFPPLSLNIAAHKAYYNETDEIILSNKEYDMLYLLASYPDEVVSFEDIGKSVWGYYEKQDRQTIIVNAGRLRKKLGEYPGLENIIETIRLKGYKFIGSRRNQG